MENSESTITAEQKVESPTDFKTARERVTSLIEQDRYARDLVGLLTNKMRSWDQNLDPTTASQNTTPDDLPRTISWLVDSDDFADLSQIDGFLETNIKRHIDSKAQKLTMTNGQAGGRESQNFRAAKEKIIESVRGYAEYHKPDPINQELEFWSKIHGSDGSMPLQSIDRLKEQNLQRVELGSLVFYVPEAQKDKVSAFGILANQMEQVIGTKLENRKRTHILLVPGSEYCPRGGFASPDGKRMILDIDHPDGFGVFAHEYTHAFLGQSFGSSKSAAAMEGAAVFFSRQRFPGNTRNDYNGAIWGFTDVIALNERGVPVGFSHTQMLDNVGKSALLPHEKYEYAYRFGGFLSEYIVTKFGKEKYLQFYQVTSRDNLFHPKTGRQLIKDGVSIAAEREIVEVALHSVGLNSEEIAKEFDAFIKNRTVVK